MARIMITGASQGIGRATAVEAVRRGHDVIATARAPEVLDDIDGLTSRLRLDVTDQATVDSAIVDAGPIDVLISNAGETIRGTAEATPPEEFRRLFDLNTIGPLRLVQALLPGFRARGGGRLLFVSSISGRVALPFSGAYTTSKWALEGLAETLANETSRFGVRVSVLEPGPVATNGAGKARTFVSADGPYAELWQQRLEEFPPGLAISAQEVADAIMDAAEADDPAFRIPVGTPARLGLADRHASPMDAAFVWVPRTA